MTAILGYLAIIIGVTVWEAAQSTFCIIVTVHSRVQSAPYKCVTFFTVAMYYTL